MSIKKIKRLSLVVFILSTGAAYATGAGMYIGAQAGASNIHAKTLNVQTGTTPASVSTVPSSTGFGARVFMGANINQYAALEMGYTHYGAATYKPSVSALCGNPQIRQDAVDVVGKGMLPVATSGFGFFGKAGVAAVRTNASGSLTQTSINPCGGDSGSNISARPTATVGVSLDLSQNWVADASWSRIFSGGGNVQNSDLVALGIAYHFVDKYCGQFLC